HTTDPAPDQCATTGAIRADPEAVDVDESDDGLIVAVGDRGAQCERDRRGADEWSTGAAAIGQTSPDECSRDHPCHGRLPLFNGKVAAELLGARRLRCDR